MTNVNVNVVNGNEVLENIKKMTFLGDVFSYLNNLGLENFGENLEIYDAEMLVYALREEIQEEEDKDEEKDEEKLDYLEDTLSNLLENLKDYDENCLFITNDYDRSFVEEYTVKDFILDFEDEILALNK